MSPDANARPKFYLRDGSLADERVWEDKQGDPAYVQIDKATIPSGYWVSTIWVGIDHDPSPDVPVARAGAAARGAMAHETCQCG